MKIQLLFIVFIFCIRGFQDVWLRWSELTYWDKGGYDDFASKNMSYGEFGGWYAMILPFLWIITSDIWNFLLNLGCILFWHISGIEDFLCYFFEPLVKLPKRDERFAYKYSIWRFPKTLHWLGASGWKNYYMMLWAGKKVELKGFIRCVGFGITVLSILSYFL